MGQHSGDLTTEMFAKSMFFILLAEAFGALAIGMGKIAVALFLMRIVVSKWYVFLQLTASNFCCNVS
jgi:hypothetical protein